MVHFLHFLKFKMTHSHGTDVNIVVCEYPYYMCEAIFLKSYKQL